MADNKQERWRELCEMAVVESDPRRITELFRQIDQLLSENEDHPDSGPFQTDAA